MALRLFGNEPTSIFALLGKDENSATFALGWILDRCPSFRNLFVSDLIGCPLNEQEEFVVDLQRHGEEGGFTDVEVVSRDFCHLIIEAKRGWTIPSHNQLETYSRRLSSLSKASRKIISVSAATREYAVRRLRVDIADVPVTHRSWADIKRLAGAAYRNANGFEEKLWLRQFDRHLEDYVSMQNPRDNLVYVVSLSARSTRPGESYSWIDAVEKDGCYFHPVGNRWPFEPPNYVGFRYRGELQTVHHIDGYEVVSDLSSRNAAWPTTDTDHFIYTLGPAMKPMRPMRTGNIFRNARVRCAIDTLLAGAYDTVREARDETNRRLAIGQSESER